MPEKFEMERYGMVQASERNCLPLPVSEITRMGVFAVLHFTHRNPAVFDTFPRIPIPKSKARKYDPRNTQIDSSWGDAVLTNGDPAWQPRMALNTLLDPLNSDKDPDLSLIHI